MNEPIEDVIARVEKRMNRAGRSNTQTGRDALRLAAELKKPRPFPKVIFESMCLPCLRGFHDLCEGVFLLDGIEQAYNCECECERRP